MTRRKSGVPPNSVYSSNAGVPPSMFTSDKTAVTFSSVTSGKAAVPPLVSLLERWLSHLLV